MSDVTETGRIFIREGTLLPKALQLESEPYMSGWRSVQSLDGYGLGRKIHDAGWTFFCLAGEIKAIVFGIDERKTVRRAIERILTSRELEKFNSLEITGVASKRFLGVPYASVSARSRHIQESVFLFRVKDLQEPAPSKAGWRLNQSIGLARGKDVPQEEMITQLYAATILKKSVIL